MRLFRTLKCKITSSVTFCLETPFAKRMVQVGCVSFFCTTASCRIIQRGVASTNFICARLKNPLPGGVLIDRKGIVKVPPYRNVCLGAHAPKTPFVIHVWFCARTASRHSLKRLVEMGLCPKPSCKSLSHGHAKTWPN